MECLDDVTAVQFVEGRLAADVRERVIAHLETCEACDAIVGDLLATNAAPTASLPRLDGRYRIESLLARGGMGEIYRAQDTELARAVAIKIPRVTAPGLLRRFEREVAITTRLEHPGIVPVHGAGVLEDGTPFYVMRFVDGTALDVRVGETAGRDARIALVPHLVAVADTMAYVHGERIVHRDLKPNNILVGKFGETIVVDWGLAKKLANAPERPSRDGIAPALLHTPPPDKPSGATTRAGDVLGTPAFMAPEQAAGEPTDERADIYALGVMLGYIVSGEVPRANTIDWTGAAGPFEAVYLRATSLAPGDRYPTAAAFATALRAALAPAPSAPERPPSRRRIVLVAIAALGIAGAGVTVWTLRSTTSARAARLELLDLTRSDMTSLALSPTGRRLGHAGLDRIEVRDLTTGKTWTRPAWVVWPRSLTWESDDELRYASRPQWNSSDVRRIAWNLTRDAETEIATVTENPPAWVGELTDGRMLYMALDPARPMLVTETSHMPVGDAKYPVSLIAIAPDRGAFAFVDILDRVNAVIRVVQRDGTTLVSPPRREITALTWESNTTLLYATGSTGHATLWRAMARDLATPVSVYDQDVADQWIGAIAARGGRVLMSIVSSRFETHWIDLASRRDQRLPTTDASAPLGWPSPTSLVTWNRSSYAIETRALLEAALPAITGLTLKGDPANATWAGDTLVIAQRADTGRRVVALDARGDVRWEAAPGVLWFVRCAGDRAPPCVAAASTPDGLTELRRIDPETGVLGELVVGAANIRDAAIDRSGTQLAWLVDNARLHRRALAAEGPGDVHPRFLGSSHSLAFVSDGTDLVLAANPDGAGVYQITGSTLTLVHATDDGAILSLIRASTDGARVSYRIRALSSQLAELHHAR